MMIISKNFTHSIFLIKRKKQYIIFFNLIENILWLTVYNFSHPHWWPQRGAPIHELFLLPFVKPSCIASRIHTRSTLYAVRFWMLWNRNNDTTTYFKYYLFLCLLHLNTIQLYLYQNKELCIITIFRSSCPIRSLIASLPTSGRKTNSLMG